MGSQGRGSSPTLGANVEYEKDDDVFSRHYNGQREQVRSNNIY